MILHHSSQVIKRSVGDAHDRPRPASDVRTVRTVGAVQRNAALMIFRYVLPVHSTRLTPFLLSLVAVVAGGVITAAVPAAAAAPARSAASGVTITGRVTDADGHPLSNVRVSTFLGSSVRTRTGPGGGFRLHVHAGSESTYIEFDGALAHGGASDGTGYGGTERVVSHVVPDAVKHLGWIRLRPAGALRGRVTDDSGHPLAGVVVYVQPVIPYVQIEGVFAAYSFVGIDRFRTNAQGRYLIKGVSRYAGRVCFDADQGPAMGGNHDRLGYRSTCLADSAALRSGVTRTLPVTELAQQTGSVVTGTVRAAGRPVPHLSIDIMGDRTFSSGSVRTDSRGRYRISGQPADRYQICSITPAPRTLFPFGLLPKCVHTRVAVAPGIVRVPTLRLPTGGAARGRLVAVNGSPVERALVSLVRVKNPDFDFAWTGPTGRYRVIGLRPGRYRACWHTAAAAVNGMRFGVRPGRCTAPFRVRTRATASVPEPHLKAGGAVVGRVTDQNGHPVTDAQVFPSSGNASVQTDRHGRYRLTGLAPGTVRVCVSRLDDLSFRQRCRRGVEVIAGQASRVNLSLAQLGSLRVQVRDAWGRPVTGADAALLSSCRGCSRYAVLGRPAAVQDSEITAANGAVTLTGIRPGRYAVCVHGYFATTTGGMPQRGFADTCTGTTFTVAVRRGHTTPVALTLAEGAMVTGRVTGPDGQPLGNVQVHVGLAAADDFGYDAMISEALSTDDPATYSRTDANGYYRIRSVVPGPQRICFDATHATDGTSTPAYRSQCVGGQPGTPQGGTPIDVLDTTKLDFQLTAGQDTPPYSPTTTRNSHPCAYEQVAEVNGRPVVLTRPTSPWGRASAQPSTESASFWCIHPSEGF